jgi:hypothetical protein
MTARRRLLPAAADFIQNPPLVKSDAGEPFCLP